MDDRRGAGPIAHHHAPGAGSEGMTSQSGTVITLRALAGQPLADPHIREMVAATAHAIAERQGVKVIDLRTADDHVTAKLSAGRIEAIGFAAELRRLTTS